MKFKLCAIIAAILCPAVLGGLVAGCQRSGTQNPLELTYSAGPVGSLDMSFSGKGSAHRYAAQTIPLSTGYLIISTTDTRSGVAGAQWRLELQQSSAATASILVPATLLRVDVTAYTHSGTLTASGSALVQVFPNTRTPCDLNLIPIQVPVVTGWWSNSPIAPGRSVTLFGANFLKDGIGTPSVVIAGKSAVVTLVSNPSIEFIMPNVPQPWRLDVSVDGVPMAEPFTLGKVSQLSLDSPWITLNAPPDIGPPDSAYVTSRSLNAQVSMEGEGSDHGVTWSSSSSAVGIAVSPGTEGHKVTVSAIPGAPIGTHYLYATSVDDPTVTATCSIEITNLGNVTVTVN